MPDVLRIKTNAEVLSAGLQALADICRDPTPMLEEMRSLIVAGEDEVWSTQGGSLGEHWPAIVDPSRKVNSEMLVASGTLRHSMTSMQNTRIEADTLMIGPAAWYGKFHESGTQRMHARPFIGVGPNAARAAINIFVNAISARASELASSEPV